MTLQAGLLMKATELSGGLGYCYKYLFEWKTGRVMCSCADAQTFGRESFRVANGDVTGWDARFRPEFQDKATCVLLPARPLNYRWRVASSLMIPIAIYRGYYTASLTKRL